MDYIYFICNEGGTSIYYTENDAKNASVLNPSMIVEIYKELEDSYKYVPTYMYYKNGKLYDMNKYYTRDYTRESKDNTFLKKRISYFNEFLHY
jgi:hypothetical protein